MVQVDAYDRKILAALAVNCRTPATRIAKKVGLSRDAIRYRIKRLESSGVIQGYRTVIDMTAFGYDSVHVMLQLNQPAPEAEQKLIEAFKSYPFCRAVIKFNGKYDFELALVARNMDELDAILTKIISDCGNYLQHYDLFFITKSFAAKTFPDNFQKSKEKEETAKAQTNIKTKKEAKAKQKAVETDEIDHKLLGIIADHADLPLYHIGQKLDLSADAVKYRMKKLQNAGIIKGFIPVINYNVIGYHVYAILLNIAGLTPQREATLKQFLSTNKDILWAVKLIGKYNVLLYICTNEPNDLIKTTTALRSYFTEAVRDYETLINYEEYKYTYWVKPVPMLTIS